MKHGPALLAAIGISVAAHAWVLSDWGRGGDGAGSRRPAQNPAHPGLQLRWITLATPSTLPATPATRAQPHPQQAEASALSPTVVAVPSGDADMATAPVPQPLTPPEHFWRPSEVDFRALPLQAPDTSPLEGTAWAFDQPVRLRLSINAQGKVVAVAPRDAVPPPADVLAALSTVFMSTAFLPARRHGQDVASLQDVEILP